MAFATCESSGLRKIVNGVYRDEWRRAIAYMVRIAQDLQVAEDCVQDAFEAAIRCWGTGGVPSDPGAWIRTTARNRFIDTVRASRSRQAALERLALQEESTPEVESSGISAPIKDDELALMFLCCHPAIAATDQVMLILRVVAGLAPKDIASCFFVHHEAVRTRLLRAKRKIRQAKIPTDLPGHDRLNERLEQVFAAIYLIYNEGYLPARGVKAHRPELTAEAIRLAATLAALSPRTPEAQGVLALLLLTEARTTARVSKDHGLTTLEDQDRSLWDRDLIECGLGHLDLAMSQKPVGRYTLQAAIAAEHAKAANHQDTDWKKIVRHYDRLIALECTPIYEVNRCVAASYAWSVEEALRDLGTIESDWDLGDHYLLAATRADFCRRSGRADEAIVLYRSAAEQVENDAVRDFLDRRILDLMPVDGP